MRVLVDTRSPWQELQPQPQHSWGEHGQWGPQRARAAPQPGLAPPPRSSPAPSPLSPTWQSSECRRRLCARVPAMAWLGSAWPPLP